MSDVVSKRRLQLRALTAATAIALSTMVLSPAMAQGRVNLSGLQSTEQQGFQRFIVKYRDGSTKATSDASLTQSLSSVARVVPSAQGATLGLRHLRRTAVGSDVLVASRKLDRADAETLMRQLAVDPDVEYVEVDKLNHATLTPNDTRFGDQWDLGTGTGGIYATTAWDVTNGAGTVVAVLDTGITSHSDLNANVLSGYDFIADTFVANDGNGRDSDASDPGDAYAANECGAGIGASNSSWHGTHVAGTIAAVTNNSKGVAGIAYGAKVLPVRVLGKCGGYDSDIADAIIWASGGTVSGVPANQNPAEVINLSLGGSGACGSTTQSAINSAVSRGTTLVIAAGNDNTNVSNASPANCNNVIAVGATTSSGARASYSNYGSLVDIAAPGSNILSTLNSGTTSPGSETYASYSGTSMATPHVAAVVALMQSVANPALTPAQVEMILKNTARAFPSTPSQPIGAGIVQARAAVDAAKAGGSSGGGGSSGSTLTNGVAVTGLSASTGNSVNYTLNVPAGATNLKFTISGGSGDADLYVRFGSAPTDSTYACRPYKSGNSESCSFASPQTGTYYVRVKAYSTYSGVQLTGSYTP
ncbi:S8 family peptidase [Pseudoxanthomonas winnipegensis]|uniref:Peptidase S8 n=1 Tax=Pseudoxanthomonas winnipegensis TaxID=2480810 RepID=A0A4V2HEN1_9GAMM|nr:S8 family peptidase [Pseudoxanthomonas winnipegensis]RZZ89138.1 peptidase S8 [Pseudoxanthomonas winnipegensis]TAA33412.1 peptidase S8 [Pseudoxanthomonas winnipegensis]TAA43999.1 peptidase S8 [Pseudoxanthomonas winnipegensis]TBV75983.1 peptidase S8 [Pseudoxanthomonas winnipegensis]